VPQDGLLGTFWGVLLSQIVCQTQAVYTGLGGFRSGFACAAQQRCNYVGIPVRSRRLERIRSAPFHKKKRESHHRRFLARAIGAVTTRRSADAPTEVVVRSRKSR